MPTPTPRSPLWARIAGGALVAALVVGVLFLLGDIVQLVVLAALLAYLLDPLATRLEARGMSRLAASAAVFGGLVVAVGLLAALLLPLAAEQVASFQRQLTPEAVAESFTALEERVDALFGGFGLEEMDIRERMRSGAEATLTRIASSLPNVLSSTITLLVVVPFAGFFLLKDGQRIRRGLVGLVPNRYFELTLSILRKTSLQLGGYLRGQLTCAFVVGLLAIIALGVIGVDYYILIGVFAGFTNLIPFLGPFMGALAAVAVSLITGEAEHVPWILASFVVIQLIDNVAVQPLVLSKNVELHPLAILFVLLLAGQYLGLVGLLLAVPAAAIAKVVIQESIGAYRRFGLS